MRSKYTVVGAVAGFVAMGVVPWLLAQLMAFTDHPVTLVARGVMGLAVGACVGWAIRRSRRALVVAVAVALAVTLTVAYLWVFVETTRTTLHHEYGIFGVLSNLEGMVVQSEVIARVRFVSVRPVGVVDNRPERGWRYWYTGALEYTFTVSEYLKGSGGPEIKALAFGISRELNRFSHWTSWGAARNARVLLDARDARWDGGELLAFLRPNLLAGRYFLGYIDPDASHYVNVTVVDAEFRALLPEKTPATSTDRVYWMDDPHRTVDTPTVQLSTVRDTIAEINRDLR